MRKRLIGILVAGLGIFSISAADALQCVPYARQESGLDLRGNAWTWWNNAAAKYERGNTPQIGSVLVFKKSSRMRYGHVAVVARVIDSRNISVDHANWGSSRGGGRGKITRNAAVVDTSPNNDWSSVRVWYPSIRDMGQKHYPTYGFIYPGASSNSDEIIQASFDVADSLESVSQFDENDGETDDAWNEVPLPQGNLIGGSKKAGVSSSASTVMASLDGDIASISPAAGGDAWAATEVGETDESVAAPSRKGKAGKAVRSVKAKKGGKVVDRPGSLVSREAMADWKAKVVDVSAKKALVPEKKTAKRVSKKDKKK